MVSAADILRSLISVFYTGAATFLSSSSSFIFTKTEWTPFQTHCYSNNPITPGSEPGASGLTAGILESVGELVQSLISPAHFVEMSHV
jgi:hypothetical protein